MSAPDITQQPVSQTVAPGANVTFTTAATGAASEQWYKDGNPIGFANAGEGSGAQSPTLTLLSVTTETAGNYFCRFTASDGTFADTEPATLTVATPGPGGGTGTPTAPVITAPPAATSVAVGATATFTVGSTGATSTEWYKASTPIGGSRVSGAQSATLTITGVLPGDAGPYHVKLTNSVGTTLSTPVQLTVTAAGSGGGSGLPVINTQPVPTTATIGSNATLSVVATGATGLQWFKGGNPVGGSGVTGATTAILTLLAVTATAYGSYSVKVTNAAGTVESVAVTLTVIAGGTGTGGTGGGSGPVASVGEWEISAAGKAYFAADLGITEITRTRSSQGTDTCTLTADGRNVDAAALFAYGTTVVVTRGGVPWFQGRVNELPASGSPSAQSQTYTLSGPWWYLEHLVFTQTWKVQGGTASARLGRGILGMDINGNPVATGEVIHEALGCATAAGAPFVVGDVLAGFTIPFDEVKDVTCAEVIKKMLRWHPDAVTWFDYSQTPPAIYIRSRGDLGPVTLTMGTRPLVSIGKITPRPDLQAPEVVIAYETTSTSNGQKQTNVQYDAAPAGATGQMFGSVLLTIPLRGQSSTTVKQPIIVTPIIDDPDDPDAVSFLVAQYGGELAKAAADPSIGADGITITDMSRALPDPDAVEYDPSDDGDGTVPVVYDDSLGNMLVQGSISEDMAKQFALKAQAQRITFSYTLDSGSGDSDNPSASDYGDVSDERTGTLDIMATNAVTQPYTTLSSYDAGDQVPTGLAANYLATLDVLQWAGNVVLEEPLAGASVSVGIGNLLNIAGSQQPAWANMGALIVQEQVQASTGRTTLTFGPAAHLSPTDLVKRLQTTRPAGSGGRASTGARGTDRSDERSSGTPSDANTIGGGTKHPIRNSTPVPPKSSGVASVPMPFDLIPPTNPGNTSTVYGQANPFSLFRPDESSTDTMDVGELGVDVALSAGMLFYLQVDTDTGYTPSEANVVSNTTGFGNKLYTVSGSGTDDDPVLWDQSFFPLAQVYPSDGTASRGGVIFASGDGSAFVEVVNVCSSHLGLVAAVASGAVVRVVIKTAATFD